MWLSLDPARQRPLQPSLALALALGLDATAGWAALHQRAESVARVRALTRAHGLPLVLSFHDFQRTPGDEDLQARFAQAHRLQADVAKLAVMPQSMEDVHRLLGATLQASRSLPIPVISMAMGGLGAVRRLCGGAFGSALTFAVGSAPSAPGQMPIEDVRAAIAVLQRAVHSRE